MDKLGLSLGYLLVQIFNFLIIMVVLKAWVYKPILGLLEKRRESIAQGLEDARIAAEARENAERDAQKIISEAHAKSTEIIREATERAEAAGREVQTAAEGEAAKAREAAVAVAEVERKRLLADVRGQIATLAMAATQKLIGEALDEQRQHVLINEFFSGVKAGNVLILEGEELSGLSAEVISALPLTPDEQTTVKEDVLTKMGDQATVTFRVDPRILGGLVIRVGDTVMDGSISGQLEDLRQSLG